MRRPILIFLLGVLLAAPPTHANPVQRDHIEVELISADVALVPGQTQWVGLRLDHEQHWHTYWRNPGDSGLQTTLRWSAPAGITLGDIAWPIPERLPVEHLVNYGYSGEMVLPVPITVDASLAAERIELTVAADWLVCKIDCIPGAAELTLVLPVATATQSNARVQELFDAALGHQPTPVDATATHYRSDSDLVLTLASAALAELPETGELELFPHAPDLVENAPPLASRTAGAERVLRKPASPYALALPEQTRWLLARGQGAERRAIEFDSTLAAPPPSVAAPTTPVTAATSIWLILLAALAGGLLLNLMPCVFPVLSLKALSLARSSEHSTARLDGALYAIGVVAGFVAIGAVLISLRAAGAELGWGFQMQSPAVVAYLALLFALLALNLAGVFEFAGFAVTGAAQPGRWEALGTGLLAVIIATPCTAPFMGVALGATLSLPAAASLAVFGVMGIGLALPLTLVHWWPSIGERLPRPGAWMVRFRQALAFPLWLTVVWLLWVLGNQAGVTAQAQVMVLLTLAAIGAWLIGERRGLRRWLGIATIVLSAGLVPRTLQADDPPAVETISYSEQALADARAAGPVFVYMTADWCITCKVNEQVALKSDRVMSFLETNDIALIEGDWTRRDEAITRYLELFGRNGVPLYVYYAPGATPQVLPQLLTEDLLIQAMTETN